MGEAKRRGTKEERTAQAIARKETAQAEIKKAFTARTKRSPLHSHGGRRLSMGLAIALAALGTSAIEVRKDED
ncbi:hypothetical protein WCE00_01660 [Acinetobacter haemolyticus]|uniref:hypothetical protein n=1 Tax=Acinetobacter haemolyticus TaxID=29430 RepID=UPI0034D4AF7A